MKMIDIPVIKTPPIRCKRCEYWGYLPSGIQVRNAENNGVRLWGECQPPKPKHANDWDQRRFLASSNQHQRPPVCYFTEQNYGCGSGRIKPDTLDMKQDEEQAIWGD